jgi:hypothetical protein
VKTYLVFEPAGGSRNADAADVRFVREKFYWSALILAPVWLIGHCLWLALGGWLIAGALIAGLAYGFGLGATGETAAYLFPSLIIAFEGAELRRRKLLRQGYRDAGTAIGFDLEDAERRFFASWKQGAETSRSAHPAARPLERTTPASVIGLFPEPGGGR